MSARAAVVPVVRKTRCCAAPPITFWVTATGAGLSERTIPQRPSVLRLPVIAPVPAALMFAPALPVSRLSCSRQPDEPALV